MSFGRQAIVWLPIAKAIGEIELEAELKKHFFTADYIRVGKELVKQALTLPKMDKEISLYVHGSRADELRPDLLAIFDGWIPDEHILYEFKTTKNGWANQGIVDTNGQITLYSLAYYLLFGTAPLVRLVRLDTGNGRMKLYETKRTEMEMMTMRDKLNDMHDDLVAKGWWEGRAARDTSFVQIAKDNTKKYVRTLSHTKI